LHFQEERGEKVKVIVTQPRRIAAITLARRVASLRGQDTGDDVGYRVGQGDHQDSHESLVTFVTVGYLLQYFSHNPDMVQNYTHIVLDEVHERSMDTDLLNLLIKKLLDGDQNHCKLVVMSATLQADLFSQYFTPKYSPVNDPIFVGVRRFPVRSVFLEVTSATTRISATSSLPWAYQPPISF
jgi:HrpA-like RNA helicase